MSGDAPEAGAPAYSVVVPAFDEEEFLPATLASIRTAMATVPHAGEIVVCDNNSRDGTAAAAARGGARVVFEAVNQISRARNAGARAARGDWLVFIDADTRVSPLLLREAVARLASGRVAGGGATIAMPAVSPLVRRGLRLWNRISVWRRLAAGAFVFARRDAFEAVGGFSQRVYASEEIWLSRAIRNWGRPRGLTFEILELSPVETSGRKAEWYSGAQLLGFGLLIVLFPFLVRSRTFCAFWYRRPARRAGASPQGPPQPG